MWSDPHAPIRAHGSSVHSGFQLRFSVLSAEVFANGGRSLNDRADCIMLPVRSLMEPDFAGNQG
jgi:hypothetical protein